MKIDKLKIETLIAQIDGIVGVARAFELKYQEDIEKVHVNYKKSALNLVHYMALRSVDFGVLQDDLQSLGMSRLGQAEAHVMASLLNTRLILKRLIGVEEDVPIKDVISFKQSAKFLKTNTKALFGYKSKKRRTRIMVTLPSDAATDPSLVYRFMQAGMNSARINCAHDDKEVWTRMIGNLRDAKLRLQKNCRVVMDLGGPKLRTGEIVPGPKVVHITPERNPLGQVINPALIWLAPAEVASPSPDAVAHIPVDPTWLTHARKGDVVAFIDSRDKPCKLKVYGKEGEGRWAKCYESAYITTGTEFTIVKEVENERYSTLVGELLPHEVKLVLRSGDTLLVHKEKRFGEPAVYDDEGKLLQPAHISCSLPEIFDDVRVGETIMFDDGKIGGVIETASQTELEVKIVAARENGSKLRADKGINLPDSHLTVSGLTPKDREDLRFIAQYADVVNFSFVNSPDDMQELIDELKWLNSSVGVILKIETQNGYHNLPRILLRAMQMHPIGVMIARGDLAVETGWKNMASIQEEILRVCEAAHVPDVWATQVLESLAKKGVPSRAEITDAAMAQRAECVMLNKGQHIIEAIAMLDRILKRMQEIQKKKMTVLPRLSESHDLRL